MSAYLGQVHNKILKLNPAFNDTEMLSQIFFYLLVQKYQCARRQFVLTPSWPVSSVSHKCSILKEEATYTNIQVLSFRGLGSKSMTSHTWGDHITSTTPPQRLVDKWTIHEIMNEFVKYFKLDCITISINKLFSKLNYSKMSTVWLYILLFLIALNYIPDVCCLLLTFSLLRTIPISSGSWWTLLTIVPNMLT